MGGTYRSDKIPVRGPPATGSTIKIDRRWSISTVSGRLREKEEEGEEEKGEKREIPALPRFPPRSVARRDSSPTGFLLHSGRR
ncbi:hypothetical protein BHE74_00052836, partial [Ensete ventricosum]